MLLPDLTSPGVLLHSADGGQRWIAWTTKSAMFRQVQFVTAQVGWAVTSDGRGSGLVHTRDGGQSWSEVWPALPAR